MNSAQLFSLAVTALPAATRERMDGAAPLDWTVLEDPQTGEEMVEAIRGQRRLPRAVETLVQRLIDDVGVVPDDLAAGAERTEAAGRWIQEVSLEADGECYRMRDRRSGEVHDGIRPEAVAGYATLALELATAVTESAERWVQAGSCYEEARTEDESALARCAVLIATRLQSAPGADSGQASAGTLASALDDAWNSQSLETREELSTGVSLRAAYAARAPRKRYFSPISSYRLHTYDLGEIRWLRALAERAHSGAGRQVGEDASPRPAVAPDRTPKGVLAERAPTTGGRPAAPEVQRQTGTPSIDIADPDSDDLALGKELAELERVAGRVPASDPPHHDATLRETIAAKPVGSSASLDLKALQAELGTEGRAGLDLGSASDKLVVDDELSELEHAVNGLRSSARRRMAESYGIGVTQALSRLRDAREKEDVRAEVRSTASEQRAPLWLQDLAAILLIDAGAETGEGLRTAALRLDPSEEPEGGYLATEPETGNDAHLSLAGLLQQMHLGLRFADSVAAALTALRQAGKEGGWTLSEQAAASAQLEASERDKLEAAQQIERALDRIAHGRGHSNGAPSALEEASMAAEALLTVGPTVRAAAGWPGSVETPDARRTEDVARIAAVAQELHDEVRSISNRIIAGQLAGGEPLAENRLG